MKHRVAIVFGGKSTEHEVSLLSASNLYNAIDLNQFDVLLLGNSRSGVWFYNVDYPDFSIDLQKNDFFLYADEVCIEEQDGIGVIRNKESREIMDKFTLVFPIIHGGLGEDGALQGFLKFNKIPFVGSDVIGSALCMDKEITKRVLRDWGIPIVNFIVLYQQDRSCISFDDVVVKLGLPLFVKPCNAGSSLGVSKVENHVEFEKALDLAFGYDKKILIEEAIVGREIECSVLGNEEPIASVLGEIIATHDFYTYDIKYINTAKATMKIPAEIPKDISDEIRTAALSAYKATCCEDFARIDFFLKEDGNFMLNEINTLPGFTAYSMYPKLFEFSGLSLTNLITELLTLALEKKRTF